MKLEAVIYDTTGDATKAVQLATKLIKDDKVSVIIGPSTTGETMAVIPVAEKEKIPLISCAAGIKITDPAKHWVFKTPANDHVAAEKILNYMAKQKQKTIALLTVTDGFGASGREQIKSPGQAERFHHCCRRGLRPQRYRHDRSVDQDPRDQAGCHHLLGHQSGTGGYHQKRQAARHQDTALHESRRCLQEVYRTGRCRCRRRCYAAGRQTGHL